MVDLPSGCFRWFHKEASDDCKTPKELKERQENRSSPDIVHSHIVTSNEHLSLITHRVYKDPKFYIQVAQQNELDTVRHLKAGSTLYLPPLK